MDFGEAHYWHCTAPRHDESLYSARRYDNSRASLLIMEFLGAPPNFSMARGRAKPTADHQGPTTQT